MDDLYQELDSEAYRNFYENQDYSDRDFLQGKDCSQEKSLTRPPVANICDYTEALEFMQYDCDQFYQDDDLKVRIFGVTETGNSVCAHVPAILKGCMNWIRLRPGSWTLRDYEEKVTNC